MQLFNLTKKPKVLIFDIDSTLYTNSEYAHEQIDSQIRYFSELRGITADEGRNLVLTFRKNWAKENGGKKISLGNLLTNFGISIEESIEWRKKLFDPKKYIKKDEKLIQTLKILSKEFYLICVTNNPVVQGRNTLEALGVSSIIKEIIGLDTTLKSKPALENFNKAVELSQKELNSKLKYEDFTSIGDRFDIDLDLPLKLGMSAILVNGVEDVYSLPEQFSSIKLNKNS